MAQDKGNEKDADAYSQQGMQQGIRYIEECGSAKGSEVGAIENEDSRRDWEQPASQPAARAFVFHSLLALP
jgi:hypothetical protein